MLTTNNASSINNEIKVNGQKLETVTSFKLYSIVYDEGPETLSRIATYGSSINKVEASLKRQEYFS